MRHFRLTSWLRVAVAVLLAALLGTAAQSAALGASAAAKPSATLYFLHAPIGQDHAGSQGLASATATFAPPQKNAVVYVERLVAGKWTTSFTGKQNGAGKFVFVVAPGAKYRARSTVAKKTIYTPAVTPALYGLTWSDEFNTTVLSPEWFPRAVGGSGTMRPCSTTGFGQVSVNGESANLSVLRDPSRIPNTTPDCPNGQYLNAMVGTQLSHAFLYGIIAARVRMANERGMHGSIWMQHVGLNLTQRPTGGNDDGGPLPPTAVTPVGTSWGARAGAADWPSVPGSMARPGVVATDSCKQQPDPLYGHPENDGAEIDLVEYFGDGYRLGGTSMNDYWPGKDTAGGDVLNHCGALQPSVPTILGTGRTPANGYHVFSVEWTPTQYVFRTDGFETFRTSYGVSRQPEYLIMSLLTSDWELPSLRAGQPSQMNVDWVRVWQP